MTHPPLTIADSNSDLCDIIAQCIAATPQQRIAFAEFMELALYHPQHGYYSTRRTGIQRDFFTSPHLGKDFGELLAEQFAQMWQILDRPHPFTLVEMGAGQGLLVQDIVRYLHRHHFECFAALNYFIIEKSAALIAEQQQRLQPLTRSWSHLYWRTWEEIPEDSIIGCCFSNELVDALPVHQIAIDAGQLQEVYVTVAADAGKAGSRFEEVIAAPSTPKLVEYFDLIDLPFPSDRYADGYRSEVNLAALDWLETVSNRLQRGYVLTIDYGYPAHRYYSPTRSEGTLQCYYQHHHHSDPYVAIGQQDITAHVDFTALERQGERLGLQTIGFTQQGLFLMALGLSDRIAALSTPEPDQSLQDILQRRETLHALADPMGLGNFGVLVQAKQLSEPEQQQTLKGFNIPPLF
ncbi:class I SAM-dependent methyltransferase [Thermocoleostomius sinensis]|uniref:Class I SAM-dependent methyltransferase n=1 Tax=Thermocoleostomius sinensis A174 TaxID=2016057 RepID=A0A9E9C956_9CYAN|nr:class I SAM-dependent methyltransferase [Thermocoleostomius sinensis]WAL62209.1 class I SAM-dependent methyltransferase [Thermocoleostomius sinensis A174]